MSFAGFVVLESAIDVTVLSRSGNSPVNATSLPTYRVYGPNGLMTSGTGSAAFKDTGTITGATNATPIVITDVAHGLKTGNIVTITGVGGNPAANGTFTVTYVTDDTYSLDSSVGNGAYTSGGTWNVTGLYEATITAAAASGYAAGQSYLVVFQGVVSAANWAEAIAFVVT